MICKEPACLPTLILRDGPSGHPLIDKTISMTPTEMLEGEASLAETKDVIMKPMM